MVAAWAASDTPSASTIQAGSPCRRPGREMSGQRCRPRQQPGRGRDRQEEAGVEHGRRLGDQHGQGGQAQRCRRAAGAAELACGQHDAGHECGAHDARRGAGKHGVDGDGGDHGHGAPAPRPPMQERGDEAGDDGDVPAADGHDVTQAGRRQVGGEVTIDAVPEAEHDAGRQSRFGLGEDRRQRVIGTTPDRLDRVVARPDDGQAANLGRGGHPEPAQVGTEVVVRRGLESAVEADRVTRCHHGVARQARVDTTLAGWLEHQGRTLMAFGGAPDADHASRPRASFADRCRSTAAGPAHVRTAMSTMPSATAARRRRRTASPAPAVDPGERDEAGADRQEDDRPRCRPGRRHRQLRRPRSPARWDARRGPRSRDRRDASRPRRASALAPGRR